MRGKDVLGMVGNVLASLYFLALLDVRKCVYAHEGGEEASR